jgi:hypothetical protein
VAAALRSSDKSRFGRLHAASPALTLGLLVALCAAGETAAIRMEAGGFKVAGWNPGRSAPRGGWSSIFAVYAAQGDAPPMLGVYTIENGSLLFRPRFPLGAGVRARAVFHPPHGSAIEAVFEIPKADLTASTRVRQVYPSTDVLPDNQLKFYVFFSAPMRRGEAWRHIHLLNQNGSAVDLPFLEQELWDRDCQRLTVLFDPGRIKRGLLPLQEAGPAIEEGKQYTLVVDRDWQDARGAPLQQGFRKLFHAGPADRTPPDTAQWRLSAPRAATSDALVVDFPKPMDYALLLRLVDVSGVAGTVNVDRQETEWRFVPSEPWKPGEYRLVVDTALEDLAGNRIGQAFDVEIFEKVSEHLSSKTISLPFRILGP